VGKALPGLLGAPGPVAKSGPPPTLAEVLGGEEEGRADEGWNAFPGVAPDAAVPEPATAVVQVVAAPDASVEGVDAGAEEEIEDVDEAQLLSEVEIDAGTLDEAEGEPEVVDAGAARPLAPALAPTVMVKIASVPPGAIVRLKRRVFGQTPISLRFRSGILFELELVKSGYLPVKKRFFVTTKAGQEVWVPLKKAPRRKGR
jgi:hypothetical protein